MKNLLRLGVLVIYALCMMQFQIGETDLNPKKTVVKYTKSMAMGETRTETSTIKLGDFVTKYGFKDSEEVSAFLFRSISVSFEKGLCNKLQSYSVTVKFPGIGDKTWAESTGKCEFPALASGATESSALKPADAVLYLTHAEPGSDTYVQTLFKTDFLKDIKNNKEIIIEYTMTAKEAIAAGAEISTTVAVLLKLDTGGKQFCYVNNQAETNHLQ
jgi:hypothetical protein